LRAKVAEAAKYAVGKKCKLLILKMLASPERLVHKLHFWANND
jgi:hypothetical protein